MDPLHGKKLIVGLGAQKSGTGWLFNYLRNHPEFCASPVKELHHFNAVYKTDEAYDRLQLKVDDLQNIVARLKRRQADATLDRVLVFVDRLRMTIDQSRYLDLFRRLAKAEHRSFGEITPTYTQLLPDGLTAIRDAHSDTGVIVQLRNPVDFVDAMVRHLRKHGDQRPLDDLLTELTARKPRSPVWFDVYLGRIAQTFGDNQVLYLFYETLFTPETVQQVCDFCNLTYQPADFELRLNGSPDTNEFSPDLRARVREALDPVYVGCRKFFGDRLPANWI